MDILEKFLYDISYKFPKGYPDLADKDDLALLENEFKKIGINLNELEDWQNHWQDRVRERGNILDIINFPKDYPTPKQEVIEQIQNEFKSRASRLERLKEFPASIPNKIGYKLMKPILIYENSRIPLELKTQYVTKDTTKTNIGSSYVAVISDNVLRTLLLLNDDDDFTIESNMTSHQEREKLNKPIKVVTAPDYEFLITPKVENVRTLINPATLPYTVKKSYRVGSVFTHKDYGTGKVVAAASSGTRSGEPDSRGMVDWVEVDFGRPYLASGKMKQTRTIKNVYTSLSPDLDIEAAE
jgi:hypothetical protein